MYKTQHLNFYQEYQLSTISLNNYSGDPSMYKVLEQLMFLDSFWLALHP